MISSINVKNFKCLKDASFRLNNLTVFAGLNSVGKTTAIQTILISRIAMEKLVQYDVINDATLFSPRIRIPLNGKYLLALGNTLEVLARDASSNDIVITLADEMAKGNLHLPFKVEDKNDSSYELELHQDWRQVGTFNNLKDEFYYLNAERLGPRLSYDADQQDFPHVGHQGEYSVQILSQKKEDNIEAPEKRSFWEIKDYKLINQVRSWMDFIIPGIYIDEAVLVGKLKKAHAMYSKSSPTNVGFGISYVLPIVISGLIAKTGTVFIVENPEAHLHPAGQSRIGQFLAKIASSGVQIIIETHSEHVINGIRKGVVGGLIRNNEIMVNFFTKDESGALNIKEINVSETGDLSTYPKGFFDQERLDIAEIVKLKLNAKNKE